MPNRDMIRILIADDHPVVRTGLSLMIQYEPGMEIVGEAANGEEAVSLFRQHRPDVTLMDLRMPLMDGVEAITKIRSEFMSARIILLTTYDGDEDIYRGLSAGAKAYLLKDTPCAELLATIRVVHAGQKRITAEVGTKLAERMNGTALTDREHEVLRWMAMGKTNQEIADVLFITEGTVKYHVNHILTKLEVRDRTQAVIVALRRGMATLS
jgi:DNA-binding NarL/FixJ family response regulator